MIVGASIVLFGAGAVLTWGVDRSTGTTLLGIVLMVLGVTGLLLGLLERRPHMPQRQGGIADTEDWRVGAHDYERVRRRNE